MALVVVQAQFVSPTMGGLQAVNALQLPRALWHPNKRQQITLLQRHFRANRCEQSLITLNVGQEAMGQVPQPCILNSPARQRATFRHQHLDVVLTGIFPLGRHTGPVWQQKTANQQHERRAAEQHRHTDPGHIKYAERRQAFLLYQAIHHQISAGANQSAGPAQNGRITQRQQQLGSR